VNDVFVIPHNPVTLTVTPQSQVNSTSGNTLLSNGRDLASQPIVAGRVSANYGDVRFSYTPNHLAADVLKFGSPTPFVALIWGDGNNHIRLYWQAGSRFGFLLRANGAFTVTNWATGALVFIPGTPNQMRVVWTAASARLYVDGVLRATITAPTNFATVPNTIYWASNQAVSYHDDAAFGPY